MNNLPNINEFTVTQLNNSIKNLIEGSFKTVKVKGEVSEVKKHSSGHVYFVLKDENETISSICWRSKVPNLSIKIEEGLFVSVTGKVTTYSPQSKYQLIVEKLNFEGEGALLKVLEDRKKKLLKEGLFDDKFKKKLPRFPKRIGVITSESGAVIRDIIHRLSDRFPIEIVLFPAKVQGKECLDQLMQGLNFFQEQFKKDSLIVPDIVVVARGGGSFEDLMPFNDERLVRKIFGFEIPIVSAVGHETDVTLCDFVADLRAPTPSAAAELIVPDRKEILIRLNDKQNFISKLIFQLIKNNHMKIKLLVSKLPDLLDRVNRYSQDLDFFGQKIMNFLQNILSTSSSSMMMLDFGQIQEFYISEL